ncbi:MAG: 1,2-phenylacetyl-CoA epoxidase subunit PaaA [Planctomycetota bacterium]|nr:1,2-phenylacetyl-CoA epoxidase subunit PaaA [Planctomycetota bacterium]
MSGAANPVKPLENTGHEDPEKLAEFEQRIAEGVLIEPGDWMPDAYRMGMLGMAEHHANSEIIGALPEGEWITRAPSMRRKLALTAKVQDEVGHGQMLYRVSQELGKSRDDMLRDLVMGKTKYHNCFNYPAPTWGDIAMIQWLIDGAAIMNQKTLADGAYGPYVRTMNRINMEEAFHFKSGEDMVLTLMSGTPAQKRLTQDAFDRWWPVSLMFFGPADKPDAEQRPAMRWRMKVERNDSLRQRFVNRFAPAAMDLGLVINIVTKNEQGLVTSTTPDESLVLDETTGNWSFTQPDWDEFWRVIRGNGPCNAHRLSLRRFSYEQGAWVRRAIGTGSNSLPPAA